MHMPRILFVEDDSELRLLVEHVLLDAGYEVDAAETLEAGAALLEHGDCDLLVADARLSDGNGVLLAELARAREIPAIIITGYAFVLNELGVDLRRYDVLLKPISPEELLASVAKALDPRN
jgi:DNA-binding response OmpR family regulator